MTFNSTIYPGNTRSSLGVVAYVLAPLSASRLTHPSAPTDVMTTTGNGRATVSWSAPATDGGATITSYTVAASPGGRKCRYVVTSLGRPDRSREASMVSKRAR